MLRDQLPGCSNKKKAKVIFQQNHYQLGRIIGQGTFGKVYQAIDKRTNQKVAIKQVYQDKRFKNRQLDVISRLDNDNVIFMKDYYFINKKQDKYLYLVMDFYQQSLQSIFKQYRKDKLIINPQIRKIIAFQLFKALYYLQNNSVCHRDLKPPNILINPQNYQLRICDFGSAKIFDKVQKNVSYICSRYYRAPQLLFQYTLYKTQIDVWSAGCILVQLLTRQPIFPGDSTLQQLIEIIKIIGTPNKQYLTKYAIQINQQINLPNIPYIGWIKILKKYNPQPQFINLIEKILIYDVQERYKPIQILKHQYFHDLVKNQEYKIYIDKLPNLFQFTRLRTAKNAKDILELQQLYKINYNKIKRNNQNGQKNNIKNKKQNGIEKLQTSDSTPLPPFQVNLRKQLKQIDSNIIQDNSQNKRCNSQKNSQKNSDKVTCEEQSRQL